MLRIVFATGASIEFPDGTMIASAENGAGVIMLKNADGNVIAAVPPGCPAIVDEGNGVARPPSHTFQSSGG